MKIAFLQPRVSYYVGGGELICLDSIRSLLKCPNLDIQLYTLKTKIKKSQHYEDSKDKVKDILSIIKKIKLESMLDVGRGGGLITSLLHDKLHL